MAVALTIQHKCTYKEMKNREHSFTFLTYLSRKFAFLPRRVSKLCQLEPISILLPFLQNGSLVSRAPVGFALLFSEPTSYDEAENTEGALETN